MYTLDKLAVLYGQITQEYNKHKHEITMACSLWFGLLFNNLLSWTSKWRGWWLVYFDSPNPLLTIYVTEFTCIHFSKFKVMYVTQLVLDLQLWNLLARLSDYCSNRTENVGLIAYLQMKLCLFKVTKSDACIRPCFANSITNYDVS